ncbi:glycosyltransferase family 4 protein [Chitinophaga qingshengii]|uniref:Glycosyltransferase family 4 protein n=1 Tax=Chitinophaga qingshengii TaxID=1569794 RepID=A0ABR7TI34_9BACT|nr:glycosyltransferase family 4 protein [Chitinophaga qingshengii]MBC9929290.1 glycosyltransferase family 4 protein [Chitinophaga qingshengii]
MRILLVNHQNPTDINAFSGTPFFMAREMANQFEIVHYNAFEEPELYRKVYNDGLESALRPISNRLVTFLRSEVKNYDYVICQGGNSVVPFYNHSIPLVLWHDSIWGTFLHGYYDDFRFEDFKKNYYNLYLWDKASLDKAALLVFSSDYVAEACISRYQIPESKIRVVPFGANIYEPPSEDLLRLALNTRLDSPNIHFTFIGKDWKRKGLTLAFGLVAALNDRGIPSILTIVGANPDIPDIVNAPFVRTIGIVDKAVPEQLSLFHEILKSTHFLLHPAFSEPFGIVLCEANAYGIPVIGTRIEGLTTIVKDGVNGYLFNLEDFVEDACTCISRLQENPSDNYRNLFNMSLQESVQRLNWRASVTHLKQILQLFM